jgi:2-dehydro-3-deoxyglucarate aldolase
MRNTVLKDKLKNNSLTVGSWVTIPHPAIVEIMLAEKFDWLVLDMEHSAMSHESAQILISSIQSHGKAALVRVGRNDDLIIKRVLDSGADGVIVPMVNSKEDAAKAVSYVKYPPFGKRGVGLARAQNYGYGFDEYKNWLKESSVLICQIEHINAVEDIEGILNTPGVDGIIIGPYDLSASMGVPGEFERPEVIEAIKRVEVACKKHNKPLGFHVIKPEIELLNSKINDGYSFLAFSLDFYFIGAKVREEMGKFHYNK